MITQIFNPTAELVMPAGILTNEANAEIETQPLKMGNVQRNLKPCIIFCAFHSLTRILFHLKDNLSHLFFSLKSRLTFSLAIYAFKVLMHYFVILFIVIRRKQITII